MLGLYVHIPFCNTICTYCDFPKIIANECKKEEYIDNLIKELESYKDKLIDVKTVYIGGGTPNSLNNNLLRKLFEALKPYLDNSIENSIEINSELFNVEQAKLFKDFNINRVSIGVQTFNEKLLKIINRHHNKSMVLNTINILKEHNIDNINVDMIYGLPYQTIENLNKDIDELLDLNIKHISYYSLILEERTVLEYQINNKIIENPDEDLTAEMAEILNKRLKDTKFKQYEISNYSLTGYESKHNLIYWNHDPYIGIGAKACGFYNNIRYQNNFVLNIQQ
jgi:oxygen-independent coproporphyrinogen-3 oxidase